MIDYPDFDAYGKFLKTDRCDYETWFANRDFVRYYYEDVVPYLSTGPISIDKVKFSIQHMIKFELCDEAKNRFADSYFELSNDSEMKRIISHAKIKHKTNHINKMKAKNKEVIDPKTLIKKSLSRKELKKVVESWIDETKKKKNKMLDERKLELMLILCYDCKSLVR